MSDLTTAEMQEMAAHVLPKLAAIEDAKRKREAIQMERQDALEDIEIGYRALTAVADLLLLGGHIPGTGQRPTLEMVACDDLRCLLALVARSIGEPLERTGFVSS